MRLDNSPVLLVTLWNFSHVSFAPVLSSSDVPKLKCGSGAGGLRQCASLKHQWDLSGLMLTRFPLLCYFYYVANWFWRPHVCPGCGGAWPRLWLVVPWDVAVAAHPCSCANSPPCIDTSSSILGRKMIISVRGNLEFSHQNNTKQTNPLFFSQTKWEYFTMLMVK